ncbi:MAG: FecR domain-containing protein [Pirellulales bacterium]
MTEPIYNNEELVAEVLRLTLRCQESNPIEDDCARLSVLLAENPQARRIYLLSCKDTATLINCNSALAPEPAPSLTRFIKSSTNTIIVLALAACVVVAAGWTLFWSDWQQQDDSPVIAELEQAELVGRIVSLANVQWAEDATEFREWSRFAVGEAIRIEAGVVELMLENSTEIVLEGPADFQLMSPDKAMLNHGKLVARCGPEAVGFEVDSPDVKIVDQGTEFGVSVKQGMHTDVVVYDGKVDLSSRAGVTPLERRLTAGEALHVPRQGNSVRITEIRGDQYLTPQYPLDRGIGRSELILSVGDNLHSSETAKYYRVIGRGFREDCPAYVDRSYQWNGVDEAGIPPGLLGGDYVMTFNDDKIRKVEIELELAKPATLYVLFDDRIPTPEWLKKDFVNTGWDIGMDEVNIDREVKILSGVGPARSIDRVFSVWRQDISIASTITLGTIRQQQLEVNPHGVLESMYGVVVTDLIDPQLEAIY